MTKIKELGTNANAYIGLQKHNDIIIAAEGGTITLHDSSTNQTVTCGGISGDLANSLRQIRNNKVRYTVDASGNLVFQYYSSALLKFSRSGMNCPSNTPSYTSYYNSGQGGA